MKKEIPIGSLCWFWDDDKSKKKLGVLCSVKENGFCRDNLRKTRYWHKNCKKVTETEIKFYVRGKK